MSWSVLPGGEVDKLFGGNPDGVMRFGYVYNGKRVGYQMRLGKTNKHTTDPGKLMKSYGDGQFEVTELTCSYTGDHDKADACVADLKDNKGNVDHVPGEYIECIHRMADQRSKANGGGNVTWVDKPVPGKHITATYSGKCGTFVYMRNWGLFDGMAQPGQHYVIVENLQEKDGKTAHRQLLDKIHSEFPFVIAGSIKGGSGKVEFNSMTVNTEMEDWMGNMMRYEAWLKKGGKGDPPKDQKTNAAESRTAGICEQVAVIDAIRKGRVKSP
jgi:hypothetical protein